MKQKSIFNLSNLLLLLAVLVAVNILAGRIFYRLDVSEGRLFTLSDYSRQVVADLKDPVTVKAYFSRNLGQYNNVRQYVKDKLADYRSYSHGSFNFELIDPGEDEQLKQEAAAVLSLGGGYQAYFKQDRDGAVRDLAEMDVMAEVAAFCRARQEYCRKWGEENDEKAEDEDQETNKDEEEEANEPAEPPNDEAKAIVDIESVYKE